MKIFYKISLLIITTLCLSFLGSRAQSSEQQRVYTNASDKKLSAYPIPAKSYIYFKLGQNLKNEAKTVELMSVIGRSIAIQKVDPNSDDDIIFNNLNQLPEGVYVGVAKNADGKIIQTTKILIQR